MVGTGNVHGAVADILRGEMPTTRTTNDHTTHDPTANTQPFYVELSVNEAVP